MRDDSHRGLPLIAPDDVFKRNAVALRRRARVAERRGKPMQHEGGVHAVAFSPDGKTVLTESTDKTARPWDITLPALDQPDRLRLSVEFRTGLVFDESGQLQVLTQEEWFEPKKKLKALGGPCDIVR